MKKLVAGVAAIGLALAVSGGVHAYQQHVENQRVAEAAEEERAANQRRQKFLDQIPKYDELWRDEYIYNEADRALGRDVDSSSARVLSPAEFEEYFHITPEEYQKQCLEKYGINADDFADDTEAEAQQRFDEAKQEKDEYEARSKARREAAEQRGAKWLPEPEKPPFTDVELQALQSGDVSYFRKSKESKVQQALNAKISELRWARVEANTPAADQTEANANTHPKEDTSGRNGVDEIDRYDRAYHEREPQESEQWNRKEISDTIDLE